MIILPFIVLETCFYKYEGFSVCPNSISIYSLLAVFTQLRLKLTF